MLLAGAVLICISCGDGGPRDVTVVADTAIEDPDLFAKVEGDFVAPDRNHFTAEGFRRFQSGEILHEEEEAVLIGGEAWLNSSEGWRQGSVNDPEIQDRIGSNPGTSDFWMEFLKTSQLDGLERSEEPVNGVKAEKITTRDMKRFGRLLGAEEKKLEGVELEEFTIWLAEDGGWPVAMRLIVLSEQYPFQYGGGDDAGVAGYEIPPKVLHSFHYGFIIATEKQATSETSEERYRTEVTLALSQVNDSSISISPPE